MEVDTEMYFSDIQIFCVQIQGKKNQATREKLLKDFWIICEWGYVH